MDKRTILAVVLIVLVLGLNQVILNRYMQARRKHAPVATTPAPGAGAVAAGACFRLACM